MIWKRLYEKRRIFALALFAGGLLFASWTSVDVADRDTLGAAEVLVPPKPRHISTPASVRAIYMTSWVAGTTDWRRELTEFIKKSEINSIVIDVKDYSGYVSFNTGDEVLK